VGEQLEFFARLYGMHDAILPVLDRVGIVRQRELPCRYLSAGQKKRLGLAPVIVAQIMAMVRSLADDLGLAVVLVEQNARSALSIANRGIVLNLGRVVADRDAGELAADERLRHAYLGF